MQARTTSKPIAYLVALTLIIGASQLLMSAKTFANESAECPCVSEDCPYGAIDDCFDDLDPYGLPPPFGSAPGAPIRPRPPVATSHATLDQAARAVRYTISLTEEGIRRYNRITSVETAEPAIHFLAGEWDFTRYMWVYGGIEVPSGLWWVPEAPEQRRAQFTVAANGLSAVAEIRYPRDIPRNHATLTHGVNIYFILDGVNITAESTGPTTRQLKARRGYIRSRTQEVID